MAWSWWKSRGRPVGRPRLRYSWLASRSGAAWLERDRLLLERRALGVDRRAQPVERLLGEVRPERALGWGGLEDLVCRRDRDRLVPERLVEQADAARRRPDERIDLVH